MPSITEDLTEPLQQHLHLVRAVETGAFLGGGARRLGRIFPQVVSVELSERYARLAADATNDVPHVRIVHGHSAEVLPTLVDPTRPTLWFLDGHWMGGDTAGQSDECPVLREIMALDGGHPDDVVVVDDARLFLISPPPPHDPAQWPTMTEVIDALRSVHPEHHVTLVNDQFIAVPPRARDALDNYAANLPAGDPGARVALRQLKTAVGRRLRSLARRE